MDTLEDAVQSYFSSKLNPTQGEIKIPATILYDVVINGDVELFRQDHFLVFRFEGDNLNRRISFQKSRLNYPLGVPMYSRKLGQWRGKDLRDDFQFEREYVDDRFASILRYMYSNRTIN